LLFLSRLGSIPDEHTEAAAVDGASWLQTLRWVVLPNLRSMIGIVVLLSMIDSLKVFNTVWVTTEGGPAHATEVLSTWSYFNVFSINKVGYGDAIAVVLLALAFLLIGSWAMWSRRENKRNA
jgi:ABC-type sugar transport system permease subunit